MVSIEMMPVADWNVPFPEGESDFDPNTYQCEGWSKEELRSYPGENWNLEGYPERGNPWLEVWVEGGYDIYMEMLFRNIKPEQDNDDEGR